MPQTPLRSPKDHHRIAGALLGLVCAFTTAAADTDPAIQPLAGIREAARAFALDLNGAATQSNVHVRVGELDPRLRLARCSEPLEAFLPPAARRSGNTSVGVRCAGEQPWLLYVPVRVAVHRTVLVIARDLPRGTLLTADHLERRELDVSRGGRTHLFELRQAVGQRLRRSLAAGTPLTDALVDQPLAVRRGDRVTLVANTSGIAVSMPGKAAANGAVGARVPVENLRSGRTVEAIVTGPGTASVPM